MKNCKGLSLLLVAGLSAALTTGAMGQTTPPASSTAPIIRPSGNPAKDNLLRLQKPLTITMTDETSLESVIKYIETETGVTFDVLWKTDKEDGLDKEATVALSVKDMPAITFLENVLQKIGAGDRAAEGTWQFTRTGAVQVGTRSRLNKFHYVQIYDINDLLLVMPVYDNAPTIDLQQILQQNSQGAGGGRGGGGGSGGGQSPFKENQNSKRNETPPKKEDRANDIIKLITSLVETDQWSDGGGDIPKPTYYQGHIIVDAPDYMQRGINGYAWWPSTSIGSAVGGRRYVSLSTDTGTATLAGVTSVPVTATVGGTAGGPVK